MTRAEFISEVAKTANITKKDAKEILDVAGTVIVAHMADEDGVIAFPGIKFGSRIAAARTCRNPKTGEPVAVPEKRCPTVKFGKAVKEAVL